MLFKFSLLLLPIEIRAIFWDPCVTVNYWSSSKGYSKSHEVDGVVIPM